MKRKQKRTKRHKALVLILAMGIALLLCPLAFAGDDEGTAITLDASGTAATLDGSDLAVEDFVRNNKGTARAYEGRELGYRYPMAGKSAFVALALPDEVLVYVPQEAGASFGVDFTSDKTSQDQLLALLYTLDAANASGGITLEQLELEPVFTSETQVEYGEYVIEFGVALEPGHYYTIISTGTDDIADTGGDAGANTNADIDAGTVAEAEVNGGASVDAGAESRGEGQEGAEAGGDSDSSKLASFMLSGNLVPASEVALEAAPEGWAAFTDFLTNMDYRPFWVSLKTSFTALIFVFVLGLAAARLTLKVSNRAKDILDAIFTIPMVLPPTVIGFLLLVVFGNSTAFGRWLIDHGIELVFTWPAAVIAATVVAFPLMYRTVRGAFEGQDQDMMDAARTLGWSESRIFFKLMMPLAWPSIAAATVLAFARAMGEFGATLFVAGNFAGETQTMPIAIYFQWMGGNSDVATFWVFVVILISFVVILFINLYARHTQKYRLGAVPQEEEVRDEH